MASDETFHLVMPGSAAAASLARKQFTRFLARSVPDADIVADVALAVGEALANAVEHGGHARGQIDLSATLSDGGIRVRIADNGPGFTPGPPPLEPPDTALSPRGFGIFLMYALMDEVTFGPRGTVLRMFKALRTE